MGEYRMIVSGGIDDQPADRYFAAQRAGYLWDILDRRSKIKDYYNDTTLSADDLEILRELDKLRKAL